MYFVYIVTNQHNKVLYIGVTGFLEGRIHDHREMLVEGFTKQYRARKLIYYEVYPDPNSAITREKQLNGWRREKKITLIQRMNPRWVDLFLAMIEGMDMQFFDAAKRGERIARDPSTAPRQARLAQDDSL